jgi:hypothetical protein
LIDRSGDVRLDTTYFFGDGELDDRAHSIIELDDGGFATGGMFNDENGAQGFSVLRLNIVVICSSEIVIVQSLDLLGCDIQLSKPKAATCWRAENPRGEIALTW